MKTILITAIGSFSADIVIKSLKRHGIRVVGCDIYQKELVVDAYSVDFFYQVPLATNREEYLKVIQEICVKENVEYIIPLTDVEVDVFNENRAWFDCYRICVCISPSDTILICRNKERFSEFMKSVPGVHPIQTAFYSNVRKEDLVFPVVCKPFNGRSSRGLHYLYNIKEWEGIGQRENVEEYVVQPYIAGRVFTVDVVRDPKNERSYAIAREEMLRTQNGAGTSVLITNDQGLTNTCKALAKHLNVLGCVNFEFIKDKDGQFHILECNPRFSGGVEFSCMAGYDFVWNHLLCFTDRDIDEFIGYKNMYIARKYEEHITWVDE